CNHTALHMTMEHGALDIARLLLDAGADPNVRDDKYNATALGWAHYFGREDFAKFIEERGGQRCLSDDDRRPPARNVPLSGQNASVGRVHACKNFSAACPACARLSAFRVGG